MAVDRGELALLHGRNHFFEADIRGAENSPAKLLWHGGNDKAARSDCAVEPIVTMGAANLAEHY